jgi:hydroxyacyl-ACP dehydratase HTD2-like protein with hotdog domain
MFNSDRIHYDQACAMSEGRYTPLLAQRALITMQPIAPLHRHTPAAVVRRRSLMAAWPAFVNRTLHLGGRLEAEWIRPWASDDAVRLTMSALAEVET